ncbi:translation initiation factor IF-2 subunit gamma [Candidatus Woesearchaeota archaeon]|nr:translation initiation factor IF-2 subunit gamma [Candidatus Woesearchaeota archaeon]
MPPRKKTVSKASLKKAISKTSLLPELNLGMVGHVDHGKTTLVNTLSGKWTDTHSEEIKRGITIRLGYADVTINKCPHCAEPEDYTLTNECQKCKKKTVPVRKISLVDAPGHESLMATMLCGANIMDGALLLISANEKCPQPQTLEHLMALEITGIKNIIVVQNKIDLVNEDDALKNYEDIKNLLKNTPFKDAPIIPISALHKINIDFLLQTIQNTLKTPERDISKPPLMFVARSFDINRPGTTPDKLVGGVVGGVLKQGILKVGDEIEILPGYEVEERNQKAWKPLYTKIINLVTGGENVQEASPGGSFAIMTSLDPSIVKSDKLVGSVIGYVDKLPVVNHSLKLKINLLERVVGAKDKLVVDPLKPKEVLMMNVYSAATVGIVQEFNKGILTCTLKRPVVAGKGARVTIARMMGQRWRLIGYGELV